MKHKILGTLIAIVSAMASAGFANVVSSDEENSMANVKTMRKPAAIIIGIECRTSNHPEAGPQDIPKLWQKFYQEGIAAKIPNKISDEVIALYCDYEGDYTLPYSIVIGCPVSSAEVIPEGMVAKTIPASTFAVFETTEDFPKSLIDTWVRIWKSGMKRTYSGDYELYGKQFAEGVSKKVDVLVAIEN